MQDYQQNKPTNNNPINFNSGQTQPSSASPEPESRPSLGNNRQAEDIFAGVDSTPKSAMDNQPQATPARPQPRPSNQPNTMPTPATANKDIEIDVLEQGPAPDRGNLKYLIIGVATLLVILIAGIFVYQIVLKPRFQDQGADFEQLQEEYGLLDETAIDDDAIDNNTDSDIENDNEIESTESEPTTDNEIVNNDLISQESEVTEETTEPIDKSVDTDGDGLSDWEEIHVYNTDPLNPDTDDDGLSDWEEIHVYNTNPLDPDTDGDGYLDGQEVMSGYNPNGPGKLFNAEEIIN